MLYDPGSMVAPHMFAFSEVGRTRDVIDMSVKFTIVGVFFALQALFLFGGGKIRVRPGPTKWRRMIVSVVIFSVMMAILCVAFIWTYFQLTGRMPTGNRPATGIEQFDLMKLLDEVGSGSSKSVYRVLLPVLGGLWLIWLVIGIIAIRTTDQPRGIGRLVACLLAGSWIEFAVALPVDLVTRQRDKDCPCVSGSWLALIFCFPILIWSIGPAIYLLFLREKAFCQRDARHSRRVLLQKSVRDKLPGVHS